MPSVFKKAGPTPGKGKMSTKGTFQSEQSHVQKHGSKKKKYVWKNTNNLVHFKHRVQVGRGQLSPEHKNSVLIKEL